MLDVCLVVGQEYDGSVPDANAPLTPTDPLATAGSSNYIYGVTLATSAADGSVTHTVLYGQTLATIAEAYGVTIEGAANAERHRGGQYDHLDGRGTGDPAGRDSSYTYARSPPHGRSGGGDAERGANHADRGATDDGWLSNTNTHPTSSARL